MKIFAFPAVNQDDRPSANKEGLSNYRSYEKDLILFAFPYITGDLREEFTWLEYWYERARLVQKGHAGKKEGYIKNVDLLREPETTGRQTFQKSLCKNKGKGSRNGIAAYVYFGLPDQEANVIGPFFSLNISRVVQSTGLGVNMELGLFN